MYTGDLFRKTRKYVETTHDGWMILSALYGAISPEMEIEPYEKTLNGQPKQDIVEWSQSVCDVISKEYATDTVIYIYAGNAYRKYLIEMLDSLGYRTEVPLQGLGIGQQKAWFKKKEESI